MNIPILNSTPGKCLACGGILTPEHKHEYIDSAYLAYMDSLIKNLAQVGCIIFDGGEIYLGHPLLKAGYMWMPVAITHIGPHDECDLAIPHHHCVTPVE